MTRSPSPQVVEPSPKKGTSTAINTPLKSALKSRTAPRYGASSVSKVRIAETTLPPPDLTLAEGLRLAIAEADHEERMLSTVTEGDESLIRKDTVREDLADISYSTRHEAGISSNGAWIEPPPRVGSSRGSAGTTRVRTLHRFDPSATTTSAKQNQTPSTSRSAFSAAPEFNIHEHLRWPSWPDLPALPSLSQMDFRRLGRTFLKFTTLIAGVALAASSLYFLAVGLNHLRPHIHWPNIAWPPFHRPNSNSSRSVYPSPPASSANSADCLEHFESLESWLNSSFSVLERRHQTSQQDHRLSLDELYDQYRSDLDIRISRATKATEACLAARAGLGKEIDTVKSDIDAHSLRIGKLEQLVESVHGPNGRQHMKNWMSAHIGAVVLPSLTSLTASFGMGFWERLKHKFATSKENYPPIEALRPWQEAGQCWCGVGPFVQLGVQLPVSVKPTLFRVEHVPAAGNIDLHSQPREMEVWGRLVNPDLAASIQQSLFEDASIGRCAAQMTGMSHEWVCLGAFVMEKGSGLASLPVLVDMEISQIAVRTKSNWGNEGYTCIYRVTLAGEAASSSS